MKRKSQDGNIPSYAKRKTEIVFDPKNRVEFLTGFHKRKIHRKKVAQNEVKRQIKLETQRIRNVAKDNVKKLYHSYKPIPELNDQDQDDQEYDTENVTVKVIELSTTDLAKENNWIGENRALLRNGETDEEQSENSCSEEENELSTVPGMDLVGTNPKKTSKQSELEQKVPDQLVETKQSSKEEKKQRGPVLNLDGVKSKKELNRKLKRHALKCRQKSKPFQLSVRAQQQKQLKKSRRVKHFKEKHLKQKGKNHEVNGNRKKRGRRE
ncbi:nucleolar protein 12 [Malaya genurostris]|uniref:nucleolar protein 12 n=1 Tax=Malaya genurostris TaxID=325434 RepID=UPI0026F3C451|nr:nucleolar protein 12 [Malaya genurostris]